MVKLQAVRMRVRKTIITKRDFIKFLKLCHSEPFDFAEQLALTSFRVNSAKSLSQGMRFFVTTPLAPLLRMTVITLKIFHRMGRSDR
jgi:hypothetical protein